MKTAIVHSGTGVKAIFDGQIGDDDVVLTVTGNGVGVFSRVELLAALNGLEARPRALGYGLGPERGTMVISSDCGGGRGSCGAVACESCGPGRR